MRSDVITITNGGKGIAEALHQAEATAQFKDLSPKDSIQLRLLTEEMTGMFRALTGEQEAKFWIEEHNMAFTFHLSACTRMTEVKREQLLAASTSGENAAAKGLMGKLRDLFARALEPIDDSVSDSMPGGWYASDVGSGGVPSLQGVAAERWSMNQFRKSVSGTAEHAEEWDELEKSVVAKVADEVEVAIYRDRVELIIYKTFH
ncbi:MAG: hypothetical protein IJT60_08480 [Clostridia bacterium]|nr:hypothetical protein [Clostridia bacterium]